MVWFLLRGEQCYRLTAVCPRYPSPKRCSRHPPARRRWLSPASWPVLAPRQPRTLPHSGQRGRRRPYVHTPPQRQQGRGVPMSYTTLPPPPATALCAQTALAALQVLRNPPTTGPWPRYLPAPGPAEDSLDRREWLEH